MYRIRQGIIALLCTLAASLMLWRGIHAVADLMQGHETRFLVFPLGVILPLLAFGFLASLRGMVSDEGALMQLGAMIQLLLILALPGFALYLALGFPVVFLTVELFETRFPRMWRDRIKKAVLA